MKIGVVYSKHAHGAYKIAADSFASLCRQVSGAVCQTVCEEEYQALAGTVDLTVLIGSDAANLVTAELYLSGKTNGFDVRYGSDDYCIRTLDADGERYLILAGGRPRATLYAVYRYFETPLDAMERNVPPYAEVTERAAKLIEEMDLQV